MALNTRSGRRTAAQSQPPQTADASSLSTLERLLLAQAVYELGTNGWLSVSKLLSKHPLMSRRPKSFFTPQSCSAIYHSMLVDAELTGTEDTGPPRSPTNLRLAQKHYHARVVELRELILAEEMKFKTLVAEIDEIRAGKWDDKITAKLTGRLPPDREEEAHLPATSSPKDGSVPAFAGHVHTPEAAEKDIVGVSPEGSTGKPSRSASPRVQSPPLQSLAGASGSHQDPPASSVAAEVIDPLQAMKDSARIIVDDEATEAEYLSQVDEPESMQGLESLSSADIVPLQHIANTDVRVEDDPVVLAEPERKHQQGSHSEEEASRPDDSTSLTSPIPESEDRSSPDVSRGRGKRKVSTLDNFDPGRFRKRPRDDYDPTEEDEIGSSTIIARRRRERQQTAADGHVAVKRFQNVIGMLHSQISAHRNGNIFHNPIKNSEAPDYHEIVKRPMDLKTIKARIKDGGIVNSLEFQRDVYLMFANAMMYNRPKSDIYTMTEEMMLESEHHINTFRQTEGFAQRTHRT